MKFSIVTVFPQMISEALQWGVVGRALQKNLFSIQTVNPRDFTTDVHKTIDDRPFGGGDGMVMLYEPLSQAVESIPNYQNIKKVYMSPAGRLLNESLVQELSGEKEIIILSGRYGGVDQRVLQHYGFESISVGDYVVSGGELPALSMIDALVRKIPGVLGNEESANVDSFAQGAYLEAPLFTRPRECVAGLVPEVLLGGDHKKIAEFRQKISLALTAQNRPELLPQPLSAQEVSELNSYLKTLSAQERELLGLKGVL